MVLPLPATSHLLIALAALLGCGTDAGLDDPAPSSPHELQEGAAGRPVRGLGPALEIGIDPYVLDVGPNSATLAWTTRAAEAGRAVLRGPAGELVSAEAEPTRHHRAHFEGLSPATTYRWSVGGVHEGIVRTPRLEQLQRFAVFGHPGGTAVDGAYPFATLGHALDGLALDFALCTGDICYFTHEASFEELFMRPFRDFLSSAPIYLAAGNHEGGFPGRYAWNYDLFRELFPYEYPTERGAFHSFVRGNVHFLSVVYHPRSADELAQQLAWIETELANSASEFRVAFLGGANRRTDGSFDRIVRALADGEVDVVFGGDGSGTEQGELGGVPYFFAGTRHEAPPNFYHVEGRPYELVIALRDASMSQPTRKWSLKSKRPKKIVNDLLPFAKAHPRLDRAVVLNGLDVPSVEFHGARIAVRNDTDRTLPLYFRYGEELEDPSFGAGRMFRRQGVLLPPGQVTSFDTYLPPRDPVSGKPWSLGEAELRLETTNLPDGYRLMDHVEMVSLFVDPLRSSR